MCFHNLPIDFDDAGRPTLREGGWDAAAEPDVEAPPEPPPGRELTEYHERPVTRVAGALEFFARVDLGEGRVHDPRTSAMVFRGYEMVLQGRDPRDAMDISSRVCGVCGGVHSTTSSMALDMAMPVVPPPLGVIARNIAQAAELVYDHVLHLCLLAGPDYAASLVEKVEPRVWRRAMAESAPHRDVHGFATIADIMRGLEPLTGSMYLE
ncbi:MAG: nickel-dependent hydrogenase large subunit, partial [Gemmatimonadetes bacterium]|nr:nickel-dependent hydrogenase large subunit [Gemmatimonadota bacterium]